MLVELGSTLPLTSNSYERIQPRSGGSPKQYHAADGTGQYSYGYTNADSFKIENRSADGVTRGVFG